MTKFKSVAHLYIGSAILLDPELWEKRHKNNESVSVTIMRSNDYHELYGRGNVGDELPDHVSKNLKPVLRNLSDMTEEERNNFLLTKEKYMYGHSNSKKWAAVTHFLLSLNIDLFGLIEAGEAIDAETLTPNPYRV